MSDQPLAGKCIVVTRPAPQAAHLGNRFEALGAETILCPTIETVPPDSWAVLDSCLDHIQEYDWLIFTSANGVLSFLARLLDRGLTLDVLQHISTAAIGPATCRVAEQEGLKVSLVPSHFQAEWLVQEMAPLVTGCRILLPRSQEARETLPIGLEDAGACVDIAPAYTTRFPTQMPEDATHLIKNGQFDCVTFTSSSAARNFFLLLEPQALKQKDIACIGAITAETVEERGLTPDIIASEQTTAGLVQAIIQFYRSPQRD